MDDHYRRERIVVETSRYRIVGEVTVPAEGHRTRISDLLNREGVGFISLVNARISCLNGEAPYERPFIAVAREHVQIAYEETPPAEAPEAPATPPPPPPPPLS